MLTGLLILLVGAIGLLGTWLFYVMRAQVNANLDRTKQITALGATPLTFQRVRQQHRDMYPASRLRLLYAATIGLGILAVICLALHLGVL